MSIKGGRVGGGGVEGGAGGEPKAGYSTYLCTHTQNTHIRKYSGMRYPEKLYLVSSKSSFHYNMCTYFNNSYIIYQEIAGFRTIYSIIFYAKKFTCNEVTDPQAYFNRGAFCVEQ